MQIILWYTSTMILCLRTGIKSNRNHLYTFTDFWGNFPFVPPACWVSCSLLPSVSEASAWKSSTINPHIRTCVPSCFCGSSTCPWVLHCHTLLLPFVMWPYMALYITINLSWFYWVTFLFYFILFFLAVLGIKLRVITECCEARTLPAELFPLPLSYFLIIYFSLLSLLWDVFLIALMALSSWYL